DAGSELRVDVHSIEPIPEADKDSTGLQQMWIWAGANIAPINWALGALGIVLKLGLWETIAVIVLGNIVGCGIFAAFTVMGHKTGVNQMVLQRSAFGRRGAYLPSALMFLMTLGWIGVNTYFPVKIAVAILGQFGIGDTWLTNFVVVTVVMVIQVLIGIYGFYAIRTFEKYTVPVTAAIMVLMSILAWTRPGVVNWQLTSTLPPAAHLAMITLLMTAIGVGWGISWVTWASDYSRFVPRKVSSTSVFWYSYLGMFVPTVWLAILGATVASVTKDTDPAKMVSAVFVLTDFFIVRHGRIDVGELYREPERSAYGDINWGAIVAFVVGLVAGWSVEDGLVPALKGPISIKLLSGADLSWLVGIVVAGGAYLLLGRRVVSVPVARPMRGAR